MKSTSSCHPPPTALFSGSNYLQIIELSYLVFIFLFLKQYAGPGNLWKIHHLLAKALGHLPCDNPSLIWGESRLDKLSQWHSVLVFGTWSHKTWPISFLYKEIICISYKAIFCNSLSYFHKNLPMLATLLCFYSRTNMSPHGVLSNMEVQKVRSVGR